MAGAQAAGHRDVGISSIIDLYLANHLSAVMGPVQLSELSQELKPAPRRPGRRQCREDQGAAVSREGWRAGRLGEGGLVPMDHLGCLASRDVPVPGQHSLVKQGVGTQ